MLIGRPYYLALEANTPRGGLWSSKACPIRTTAAHHQFGGLLLLFQDDHTGLPFPRSIRMPPKLILPPSHPISQFKSMGVGGGGRGRGAPSHFSIPSRQKGRKVKGSHSCCSCSTDLLQQGRQNFKILEFLNRTISK